MGRTMITLAQRGVTAILDDWYGGLAGKPISYSPEHPSANPYLSISRRRAQPPARRRLRVSNSPGDAVAERRAA